MPYLHFTDMITFGLIYHNRPFCCINRDYFLNTLRLSCLLSWSATEYLFLFTDSFCLINTNLLTDSGTTSGSILAHTFHGHQRHLITNLLSLLDQIFGFKSPNSFCQTSLSLLYISTSGFTHPNYCALNHLFAQPFFLWTMTSTASWSSVLIHW